MTPLYTFATLSLICASTAQADIQHIAETPQNTTVTQTATPGAPGVHITETPENTVKGAYSAVSGGSSAGHVAAGPNNSTTTSFNQPITGQSPLMQTSVPNVVQAEAPVAEPPAPAADTSHRYITIAPATSSK